MINEVLSTPISSPMQVVPSSTNTQSFPSNWKKVLFDLSKGDDEINPNDYEDVRCELQATGHHLTSVLMNPRESLLENIFDEFAVEQSQPLDYQSPLVTNTPSLFSTSFHGSNHKSQHSSHSSHSSHSIRGASAGSILVVLELTQIEIDQLNRFLRRLEQVYKIYIGARGPETSKSPSLHEGQTKHISSRSKKQSTDELRLCYLEVPDIYFRAEFSLLKQEYFNQAILLGSVIGSHSHGHKLELNSTQQQDRLSQYLDLVEVALLRQIWSQSPAFFRALDDLKGLKVDVSEALQQLKHFRAKFQLISDSSIAQAIEIPKMHRRKLNSAKLQVTLDYINQWMQGRMAILALLEIEDYFTAQELLFSVQKVYKKHLSGIVSLKALAQQLMDVESVVSEVLCNKFITMGIQWLDTGMSAHDRASDQDILNEFTDDKKTNRENQMIIEQQELLLRLLQTLVANGCIHSALNMYKNRLIESLKLIIRTCVMEYMTSFDVAGTVDDSSGAAWEEVPEISAIGSSESMPYVNKVRDMSSESFLSCMSMCFEHIISSLKKAEAFHNYIGANLRRKEASSSSSLTDLILDKDSELMDDFKFTDSIQSPKETAEEGSILETALQNLSNEERDKLMILSKSVLSFASEVVQKSITQLINYRKDVNAKFEPTKMKFLWEISLNFVLSLEQSSAATAFILRQCLLMQTRQFLDHLHETYKNRLVNTLDNERWVQCDIPPERQRELDRLSSGKAFLSMTSSSSSAAEDYSSVSTSIRESESADNVSGIAAEGSVGTTSAGDVASKRKETRAASVDGVEYKVVWSVLLLTEIVLSYLDVAFHFSPVTAEVITKIVEQIRLFNSRAKQLVLGAQAIQSAARLKSISAKHLAITGQSLSLFIALLPHIRAALLAQIPVKHQLLLTELDRISQDLFDHHAQIVAKFVSIVGDTIEQGALKLRQVDWDRSQGPYEYFDDMQRNVTTLHKVLQTILPPEQIQDVFSRIFGLLNRKIPAHFEEIMPSTSSGKQRILDEVTHLVSALSRLKQVDPSILTTQLEDVFRKKYLRS